MKKSSASAGETSVSLRNQTSNAVCLGAAFLVKHKAEGKEYIAKKILLG